MLSPQSVACNLLSGMLTPHGHRHTEIHMCAWSPVFSHLYTHCPHRVWAKFSPIAENPGKELEGFVTHGGEGASLSQRSEQTEPGAQGKVIQMAESHCGWCAKKQCLDPRGP